MTRLRIAIATRCLAQPLTQAARLAADFGAQGEWPSHAEVVVTDAGHDVAKQISDVEDMLQQNIDILLLNPTDSAGIEAAVHAAKAAGVIVVAVDANANGPVDTFVGSKNRDAGYMSCKYLGEALGGKGEVLFSMINMVKPGTFNPYRMEQFSTPGVSLFMQLPLRSNAAFAFEHMLQAADQLASDLDAMLTDASRSPLSDDTIARYRHELAAYEASRD